MDKREIEEYNEALAIQKIKHEFYINGLLGAMKLCQFYMGLSVQDTYAKVKEITEAAHDNA